ncbi:MAG: T9SS type A sorting domain-containing protein [Chitinophagales bacterium]
MKTISFSTVGGFQAIFTGMQKYPAIIFFLSLQMLAQPAFTQSTQPPFSIELEEITFEDWPGLHSFAYGAWNGRWMILCGRKDGMHAISTGDPFPPTEANHFIWLLDPLTGEQWSKSIYTLPLDIANQLQGTNPQYVQRGKYLYITGGYGKDTVSGDKITYPSLLAIDLDMLDDILISDEDATPAFRKLEDSLFMVCGGEMEILDDKIYLLGGHVFTGEYTKPASPSFTQEYTNALRRFSLYDDGTTLLPEDIEVLEDSLLFHRRDLNFEPVMFEGETERLAAYSGVFQYDSDIPWLSNIYFNTDGTYEEDTSFMHRIHNYTCPVMNVFDSVTNTFYATFFGGISQYYFDELSGTVEESLNIPFINDITTFVRYADGSCEQVSDSLHFDALLGSNAIFKVNDEITKYNNNIIKLHALNGTYDAGFIFGGIYAFMPNFTPSLANNRLFKVKIIYEPPVPEQVEDLLDFISVFPNPASHIVEIKNHSAQVIQKISIRNVMGEILMEEQTQIGYLEHKIIHLENYVSGYYFLFCSTGQGTAIKEIIVE